MSVAQFEARISVPVAMKVDVETFAVLRDDRLLRGLDEALEILPGLFGQRIPGGAFDDLAITVDLTARDATDDHVRVLAGARDELVVDGPGELLGIGVEGERAFLAIRKFVGLVAAAVRGREHEGKAASDILDVLITTEGGLAGLRRLSGAQDDGGCEQADAEEAGHAVSKPNHPGGSSGRKSANGPAGEQRADRGFFRHGIRGARGADAIL